jgi:pentose-5-phosphate-3-epimerase
VRGGVSVEVKVEVEVDGGCKEEEEEDAGEAGMPSFLGISESGLRKTVI